MQLKKSSSSLFAAVLVLVSLTACQGFIETPTNASVSGAAQRCPKIPTSFGRCQDVHVLRTALTCGGDGTVAVANSISHGGATRIRVQFKDGSLLQGTLITPDPGCWIKDGTKADFTFGVVYTGDLGVETGGSGTQCIVQSRMDYTSFRFALSLMDPNEGTIKDLLHQTMDTNIIQAFFPTTGAPTGRCARWRVMPAGD
jgi:hypothetical protein